MIKFIKMSGHKKHHHYFQYSSHETEKKMVLVCLGKWVLFPIMVNMKLRALAINRKWFFIKIKLCKNALIAVPMKSNGTCHHPCQAML